MKSHDSSNQLRRVKRFIDPSPGLRWYGLVASHIRYQGLCQSRCPTKFHVNDCKYVETSVNVSPAPGGWHFIPHKRCRHFGQFAYTCVTPIWVCKMQLFKPTCALLTKENCSHSSASCTRHGANLSNLKRYEKQDRHQI